MSMIECKECKANISNTAKACPQCGAKLPPKTSVFTWVFGGIFSVSVLSCIFHGNEPSQQIQPVAQPWASSAEKDAMAKQEAAYVAALKTKCVDQIEAVMAESNRLLKAKKIAEATYEMEKCSQHLVEPRAMALLETLRKTRQAKLDTEIATRGKAEKAAQRRQGVSVGMSSQNALDSSWGKPQKINRTTGSFGVHEQWVYGGGGYLYFENGILRTIQN